MINCVKCFLEVNKNSANKFVLVKCIFDTINKPYNGMDSGKILPKAKLFEIKVFLSLSFVDDTGLRNIQDCMHAINKTLNKVLRELSFWLNANKIALNVAKTEIILFKTCNKNYDACLKRKLCRKRIQASHYVKYLGIFIDENLNWKKHIYKQNFI